MPSKPIEVVVIRALALRPRCFALPAPPVAEPPERGEGESEQEQTERTEQTEQASEVLFSAPSASSCSNPPDLSPQQERDLAGLLDALSCPVRQRILLALCAAGPRGANPTGLEARTGIAQKTLSHHLAFLRTAGLLHDHRRGREVWYQPADNRLRCQRHADGGFALTLTARGGGVGVTITIPVTEVRTQERLATEGARTDTDEKA